MLLGEVSSKWWECFVFDQRRTSCECLKVKPIKLYTKRSVFIASNSTQVRQSVCMPRLLFRLWVILNAVLELTQNMHKIKQLA